jgi:hypothetical protein
MCDNTEAAARRRKYIANRDYLTGGEFVIEAFGKTIRLIPEEGAGELCGKLWSVALVLINQLEKDYGIDGLRGKRVLELGAGLGAVGLALACAGADVTCTDIPDCIEMLYRCDFVLVHLHACGGVRSALEWCLQLTTGENANIKLNAMYGLCWVNFARMRLGCATFVFVDRRDALQIAGILSKIDQFSRRLEAKRGQPSCGGELRALRLRH